MDIDRTRDPIPIDTLRFSAWVTSHVNSRTSSQGKLARDLGVSPMTVQRWRRGEVRYLYEEVIIALAAYMGKSVQEFMVDFGADRVPEEARITSIRAASDPDDLKQRVMSLEARVRDLETFMTTVLADPECQKILLAKLRGGA